MRVIQGKLWAAPVRRSGQVGDGIRLMVCCMLVLIQGICCGPHLLGADAQANDAESRETIQPESQDRSAAEWTLLMGGSVQLSGDNRRIRDVKDLPEDDLALEVVDLVGTNVFPPDLVRLNRLRSLKTLHLPGPMWNTRAGAQIDYSRDLKHLAAIPTLEELTFSYSYLAGIKFEDDGLEELIPRAESLRIVSLENTSVKGRHLSAFTKLEHLDLVSCPVDDRGLEQIQHLKQLKILLLGDDPVTDAGMTYLKGLVELEHLDLSGTNISDAGIVHLGELNKLKKLNLRSAHITDSGLKALEKMTGLEELDLYGTQISNVGIELLSGLNKLRQVDLRYTQVTQAGVEKLEKSVAGCQVTFVDAAPRPSVPREADILLVDADDMAVAQWVHDLGGKTELQDGQVAQISLEGTSVTDRLLENLRGLRQLRELSLAFTQVSDVGLQKLSSLRTLSSLNLDGTTISDAGLASLAVLTELRQLQLSYTMLSGTGLEHLVDLKIEDLRLSGSPIDDAGMAQLGKLQGLHSLRLAYTNITDDGLMHLVALPKLEYLDLAGTDVGNDGLVHLGQLPSLTSLLLSYSRITDKGMPHLAGLKQLKELSLIRTRVTDKSMDTLGQLTHLQRLTLDYTDVGDAGLKSLQGLTELEILQLDSTNITDAAVESLTHFSRLRELNLYHTLISEEAHAKIRSGVPKCKIIWEKKSGEPTRRRS